MNLLAVIVVGFMAYWASERANEINQGQNTLELLVSLDSPEVRRSRGEIDRFFREPDTFDTEDFHDQNDLLRGIFGPFIHQVNLLAYCVEARLCKESLVFEYACGTLLEIFSKLDAKLDLLPTKPSSDSAPLNALISRCTEFQS